MFSLKNKNIVITGSLGLLGREFVESIAEYKGNLILIDLDQSKLDEQAKKIETKYNIKCKGYSLDISDESCFIEKMKILKNDFKKIDGLINNAANNPKVKKKSGKKLFPKNPSMNVSKLNKILNVKKVK